ncbi:MAG: hypothetical protein HY701_12255, partial [Gemmatimonadetes bacterium]|nr:hypothetical protein [Gemmatimonadota bacterium]
KATQLSFQAKEAEALLSALREEREVATRLYQDATEQRSKTRPIKAG